MKMRVKTGFVKIDLWLNKKKINKIKLVLKLPIPFILFFTFP